MAHRVRSLVHRWLVVAALLAGALVEGDSHAEHALPDYRYFRELSIDLLGRPATRAELAAFDAPGFELDAWLDSQVAGAGYAERMRRVYADLLRLEVGPSFQFVPNPIVLRRQQVMGPDGAMVDVFFRRGQRRVPIELDGDFCFSQAETGLAYPPNAAPIGTARPVSAALLDEPTAIVKPWWLYADYRGANPTDRIGPDWATRFPGFQVRRRRRRARRVSRAHPEPAPRTRACHAAGDRDRRDDRRAR